MNLTHAERFALAIGQTAHDYGLQTIALVELHHLATRRYKAAVRHCNLGTNATLSRRTNAERRLAGLAAAFGLTVKFNGLWPTLHTADGREMRLPSAD